MKNSNVSELNEKFKKCPTKTTEIEINGKKYVVVSHFTGEKDLDEVVYKGAYSRAMNEVLHSESKKIS